MNALALRDDELHVARGDSLIDEQPAPLTSPLQGVDGAAWTRFVRCMCTAPLASVSRANDLGMFEMTPRRLVDLGLAAWLRRSRSAENRTIWVARFVWPLTTARFLCSPRAQYNAFRASMVDYSQKIASGAISRDASVSLSGALAILHRAGPHGLSRWTEGARQPATALAYDRAAGVF